MDLRIGEGLAEPVQRPLKVLLDRDDRVTLGFGHEGMEQLREGGAAMFLVLDKHLFVRQGTGVDAVLHHGPAEPFDLVGPRAFSGRLLSLLALLVHMESSDSKPSRAPTAEVRARVEGVFEDFLSHDMFEKRLVWEIRVETLNPIDPKP